MGLDNCHGIVSRLLQRSRPKTTRSKSGGPAMIRFKFVDHIFETSLDLLAASVNKAAICIKNNKGENSKAAP